MKLWMRIAIFGSIFMVLIFLYQIKQTNSKVYIAEPQYSEPLPAVNFITRKEARYEDLIANISEDEKPFKPLFFETMNLKGIMKDNFNRWIAIFSDNSNGSNGSNTGLLKFAAGETYDGITLLSIDNRGCVIKYGNIERRFEVK